MMENCVEYCQFELLSLAKRNISDLPVPQLWQIGILHFVQNDILNLNLLLPTIPTFHCSIIPNVP
jgi:hypothetical protein